MNKTIILSFITLMAFQVSAERLAVIEGAGVDNTFSINCPTPPRADGSFTFSEQARINLRITRTEGEQLPRIQVFRGNNTTAMATFEQGNGTIPFCGTTARIRSQANRSITIESSNPSQMILEDESEESSQPMGSGPNPAESSSSPAGR